MKPVQWMENNWFKEWEELAKRDYHGHRCGYWCYDSAKQKYIFISN